MKLLYSVECDCGETMTLEETEYVEELEYEKHIHVCPKCHKAAIVSYDGQDISLTGEDEDVYEEYPE